MASTRGAIVYPALSLNGDAVATRTLTGAGSALVTAGIPCRGARMVLIRMTATNGNAPSAFDFNLGSSPLRADSFSTQSGGLTPTVKRGNIGIRCDQTNGNCVMLVSLEATGIIPYDYCQLSVTPHASLNTTGFGVSAEVFYPWDPDAAVASLGQANLTVSTA